MEKHSLVSRMSNNTAGMTLIELLIVLVIVSVLSAVAVPQFRGMVDRARISTAEHSVQQASRGIWFYQTENDSLSFPDSDMINSYSDLQDVVREYIGNLPEEDDADFTFISYSASDTSFTLVASAKDRDATVITCTNLGITR
jgi:prepilin-type N-terminal cleavage/methylation domain-containing protein